MQIIVVKDFQNAIGRAKDVLYEKVDRKTVLFLSGGATPKSLYTSLAKDTIIHPAAVGMVDERYGKKMHEKSNELMIQESGLLEYLDLQKVPFYPILGSGHPELGSEPVLNSIQESLKKMPKQVRHDISRKKAAEQYDKITRDLFFHFHKSVAVMGIGTDGHIAGIPPIVIPARQSASGGKTGIQEKTGSRIKSGMTDSDEFVVSYKDQHMVPPERITMTFAGLSLIDYFVVLAFGKEKKKPLQQMFTQGPLEEVPARFFMQQAPNNTVVITDQQV